MRRVSVVIWFVSLLCAISTAIISFVMGCAVNSADDDQEVLRWLDVLGSLSVLPHQIFACLVLLTYVGLLVWIEIEFGIPAFIAAAVATLVCIATTTYAHFVITRASVAVKARPHRGLRKAALRRAMSTTSQPTSASDLRLLAAEMKKDIIAGRPEPY